MLQYLTGSSLHRVGQQLKPKMIFLSFFFLSPVYRTESSFCSIFDIRDTLVKDVKLDHVLFICSKHSGGGGGGGGYFWIESEKAS